MKKYLEYAGLVVLTLVLAYLFVPVKETTYGSATGYDSLNLTPSASTGDSYAIAVAGTSIVDMSGNYVGSQTGVVSSTSGNFNSLSISGGTAITGFVCTTTTWNPSAAGSTTVATVDVTTTGIVLGDLVFASIATSTRGLGLDAEASTTDITAISLSDPDNTGAAIDISTTTLKVCYLH